MKPEVRYYFSEVMPHHLREEPVFFRDHHKQSTLNEDLNFHFHPQDIAAPIPDSCSCQEVFILTQSSPIMFNKWSGLDHPAAGKEKETSIPRIHVFLC